MAKDFEMYIKRGRVFWRYSKNENWQSAPYGLLLILLMKAWESEEVENEEKCS